MRLAIQHDLQLKLEKRPGEFVSSNTLLALTLPASRITDEIEAALRNASVWERIGRRIRTRSTRYNN